MRVKEVATGLGLDTSHFRSRQWARGTGSGRNVEAQRAAKRRWYENHREVYAEGNARRRKERAKLLRRLKDRPCHDCGQRFPCFVMEFDHREGEVKEFPIARAIHGIGVERLMAEIAKCDVVCGLCHRYRTAQRAGWDEETLVTLTDDT